MTKHWQLVDESAGIHRADYAFGSGRINMASIALGDGRLLVFGAGIDVSDEAFAELDGLGTVAAVIAPGPFHHLGLPDWRARYPDATFVASAGGLARIPKQHKGIDLELRGVDALAGMLPESVRVCDVDGMKQADVHVSVRSADGGETWFTNELISNQPELPKQFAFRTAFKLFGVGTGLELNGLTMLLTGSKKGPVGSFYRRELDAHPPTKLLPSHGVLLEAADLAGRLREILDRKL